MIREFILVGEGEDNIYPIDTEEEIAYARAALREVGLESAPVWYGDGVSPDCYKDKVHVLFASRSAGENPPNAYLKNPT